MHAIRRAVFEGRRETTRGGLTKADLKENKRGKLVSVKRSKAANADRIKQFRFKPSKVK